MKSRLKMTNYCATFAGKSAAAAVAVLHKTHKNSYILGNEH